MRVLWTLAKIIIGLAVAIPLGIVVLVVALGVLGTLLGLAVLTLKLACVALIGYGLFRVARSFFATRSRPAEQTVRELTMPDPYYEAAMRELDAEMPRTSGR
jgi:hypothetical protein